MSECPHCKSRNIHLSMVAGGNGRILVVYDCRNCWRSFEQLWEHGKGITVTERKSTPEPKEAESAT